PALLALCAGCQQSVSTKDDGPQAKDQGNRPADSRPDDNRALTGTLSCSNRGCHASLDQSQADEKPLECSFTLSNANAPPTRASEVPQKKDRRYRETGRQMSTLLHPDVPIDKDGTTAVAKDRRCLACHVTPQSAYDADKFDERGVAKVVDEEWRFGVG